LAVISAQGYTSKPAPATFSISGFAIHQFIGYQQLAQDRLFNFYIGGELMAGFTKALRDFDFNLAGPPDTSGRVDLLLGVKAGLIIPFYIGEGREIFY